MVKPIQKMCDQSFVPECLSVFKSVKKYRYLLDSVTVEHILHLHGTELFEFLEIMAFRSVLTTRYDLSIPEITSACGFMRVIRDGIQKNKMEDDAVSGMITKFQDALKRCGSIFMTYRFDRMF